MAKGPDRVFKTYPFVPVLDDPCPNKHVRQQSGAAQLLDCRAYELTSAGDAGGYDVESDLVPDQTPFAGYPNASNPPRVLYAIHGGGIPGTDNPTNRGTDPYVATRGEGGWTTEYVGVPASNPFATAPFSSVPSAGDASLETFAFGAPGGCSPCFPGGYTGFPVRLPNGDLVQGMAGSLDPGPGATPAGLVRRDLSADGTHFVFGSTSKFEPDGNSGEVSIYDRNLETGVTNVVSKTPAGATMTGPGIGELDISADGSRIIFGQLVSTDSAGNRYWHLYANVGGADHSIDLMPGSTSGALYDGMTADGTKVFFSTEDQMTGDDHDSSVDIFRADLTPASAPLTRVSTGSGVSGDTDSCDPIANTAHQRWNSLGSAATCDAVAVGGGGGVAPRDGSIYFFSPEALDTSNPDNLPVADAPNLYLARPGSAPQFITTLESNANAPLPPPTHSLKRTFGPFVTPTAVAIDHSNGDSYILDNGPNGASGSVYKVAASGKPVASFGNSGKITVPGAFNTFHVPGGIAVDNDPSSPNYRDLFVPDAENGKIRVYDPSGAQSFVIESATEDLHFLSAVAVSPSTGDIYFASIIGGVYVYDPAGTRIASFSTIPSPSGIAVDSTGKVYIVNGGGFSGSPGSAEMYSSTGTDLGQLSGGPAKGVAVDPADDHVYLDQGDRVIEFDTSGNQVGPAFGVGTLAGSINLGADSGTVNVANLGSKNVASFGPLALPSDPAVDNPLVLDSVGSAETRYTGDFQVNPSGDNALFTSTLPLTDYDNAGFREIYRYAASTEKIDCVSCDPTGVEPKFDSTMASNGLSLTNDGRAFFTTAEPLAARDQDETKDAYEWKEGNLELISSGTSPFDSGLLSVSADGKDAYFFTRDTLVPQDTNGPTLKIYDAREGGGFPYLAPETPCKASDECHGAGTPVPPTPNIGSVVGTPGNHKKHVRHERNKGKQHHHRAKRGSVHP